jgi:hypothetical protein
MPKPQLLTKEKAQKRTEEEIDVDLPDEAKSTPSKKKQKKSVSITETKEERRSGKKRKLALDEEEGENGRALLVPITGEGEKKKKDEAEHQNKKRKLDLTACDEKQEEEEVPEKPWLTSITLFMDSPQSRLSSPIKVVRREVAWPTEHVVLPRSQAQVRLVLQKHSKGHWGPIPMSPSLTLVVEKLAKTGIMSVGQMHSYNFWLKTQQATVCHRKVAQQAPHLAQLYGSGQSIVELSAKFDLPPVSLFRAIISARDNLSKIELKRAMSEESDLDERDRLELARAREADMITTDQRPGQLANADLFEAEIEKYLRSNGIRFKRQDELTQEQTHFFQAPFSTPDFLLVDEVFINGHQVRWIDAKNYYGSSDVIMQVQSMKKQANRYVGYWGPGAMVFALGYCSELTLPASVLKLDASSFSTAIPLDAYSK